MFFSNNNNSSRSSSNSRRSSSIVIYDTAATAAARQCGDGGGAPITVLLRLNKRACPVTGFGFAIQGDRPCRLVVMAGGIAQRMGLKTGDEVVAINGKPLNKLAHFELAKVVRKRMKHAKELALTVVQRSATAIDVTSIGSTTSSSFLDRFCSLRKSDCGRFSSQLRISNNRYIPRQLHKSPQSWVATTPMSSGGGANALPSPKSAFANSMAPFQHHRRSSSFHNNRFFARKAFNSPSASSTMSCSSSRKAHRTFYTRTDNDAFDAAAWPLMSYVVTEHESLDAEQLIQGFVLQFVGIFPIASENKCPDMVFVIDQAFAMYNNNVVLDTANERAAAATGSRQLCFLQIRPSTLYVQLLQTNGTMCGHFLVPTSIRAVSRSRVDEHVFGIVCMQLGIDGGTQNFPQKDGTMMNLVVFLFRTMPPEFLPHNRHHNLALRIGIKCRKESAKFEHNTVHCSQFPSDCAQIVATIRFTIPPAPEGSNNNASSIDDNAGTETAHHVVQQFLQALVVPPPKNDDATTTTTAVTMALKSVPFKQQNAMIGNGIYDCDTTTLTSSTTASSTVDNNNYEDDDGIMQVTHIQQQQRYSSTFTTTEEEEDNEETTDNSRDTLIEYGGKSPTTTTAITKSCSLIYFSMSDAETTVNDTGDRAHGFAPLSQSGRNAPVPMPPSSSVAIIPAPMNSSTPKSGPSPTLPPRSNRPHHNCNGANHQNAIVRKAPPLPPKPAKLALHAARTLQDSHNQQQQQKQPHHSHHRPCCCSCCSKHFNNNNNSQEATTTNCNAPTASLENSTNNNNNKTLTTTTTTNHDNAHNTNTTLNYNTKLFLSATTNNKTDECHDDGSGGGGGAKENCNPAIIVVFENRICGEHSSSTSTTTTTLPKTTLPSTTTAAHHSNSSRKATTAPSSSSLTSSVPNRQEASWPSPLKPSISSGAAATQTPMPTGGAARCSAGGAGGGGSSGTNSPQHQTMQRHESGSAGAGGLDIDLEQVLQSECARAPFHQFLQQQFCAENINFYLAVEEYKKIPAAEQDRRLDFGRQIYDRHFAPNCIEPVNIDNSTSNQIREAYKNNRFTADVYDVVQYQIFHLLKYDCWPRYVRAGGQLAEELGDAKSHDSIASTSQQLKTGSAATHHHTAAEPFGNRRRKSLFRFFRLQRTNEEEEQQQQQRRGAAGAEEQPQKQQQHCESCHQAQQQQKRQRRPLGQVNANSLLRLIENDGSAWAEEGQREQQPQPQQQQQQRRPSSHSPKRNFLRSNRRSYAGSSSTTTSSSSVARKRQCVCTCQCRRCTAAKMRNAGDYAVVDGTGAASTFGEQKPDFPVRYCTLLCADTATSTEIALADPFQSVRQWTWQMSNNSNSCEVVDAQTGSTIDPVRQAVDALNNRVVRIMPVVKFPVVFLGPSTQTMSNSKPSAPLPAKILLLRCRPALTVGKVLRPIMAKYNVDTEQAVVCLAGTCDVLKLQTPVSNVCQKTLAVMTQQQFAERKLLLKREYQKELNIVPHWMVSSSSGQCSPIGGEHHPQQPHFHQHGDVGFCEVPLEPESSGGAASKLGGALLLKHSVTKSYSSNPRDFFKFGRKPTIGGAAKSAARTAATTAAGTSSNIGNNELDTTTTTNANTANNSTQEFGAIGGTSTAGMNALRYRKSGGSSMSGRNSGSAGKDSDRRKSVGAAATAAAMENCENSIGAAADAQQQSSSSSRMGGAALAVGLVEPSDIPYCGEIEPAEQQPSAAALQQLHSSPPVHLVQSSRVVKYEHLTSSSSNKNDQQQQQQPMPLMMDVYAGGESQEDLIRKRQQQQQYNMQRSTTTTKIMLSGANGQPPPTNNNTTTCAIPAIFATAVRSSSSDNDATTTITVAPSSSGGATGMGDDSGINAAPAECGDTMIWQQADYV